MSVKPIDRISTPQELGRYILRGRKQLASPRARGGVNRMRYHSDLIDTAIRRIFDLSLEHAAAEMGPVDREAMDGICLVATGGYGRRELSPFSDIDVTFVAIGGDDPRIDYVVKSAYRLLMDVFLDVVGLKVGYAYREPHECHELPLDTHTALLDSRLIAGSQLLFDRFHSTIRQGIVPAMFVAGHIEQRSLAAKRWGASPYRIEPNIKEGVGGLRDLQTARWIAQAAFGLQRRDVWRILRSRGIVTDSEMEKLDAAMEFLARVRNTLHIACGRGSDVLSVDRQGEIASVLGFRSGTQALMNKYYPCVEHIARIYGKVCDAAMAQPLEIELGLTACSGKIEVSDRGLIHRDPEAAVRIFEHGVALDLEIGRATADLLSEYMGIRRSESTNPPDRSGTSRAFLRMLSRNGAGRALREMARTGMLQWIIPEFEPLMLLIPGDAAHELTVGAHSLETTTRLESFADSEDDELREVFVGISQPDVLLLAALLHDIGKLDGNGSHAHTGAVKAAAIGHRLGLRPQSIEVLEFLVRNHLVMSETARLRDLGQRKTVDDFARIVKSHDLLDMLYLLTVADIRSVGQVNWGEVQMRFLRELYHRTATSLRRPGAGAVDLERHRGRLARELSIVNLPEEEVDEHFRAMPASYLLNTSPDDLAAHISYVRRARSGIPVVRLRDDPAGRYTVITICALDDPTPGLLAKIAGVLAAVDVDVHGAQVYTRESHDRIAIDSIYVDYDRRTLPELKKLQVQSELVKVLSEGSDVERLFARFGRQASCKTDCLSLRVMSQVSDQHTVIEIESGDEPGLLYSLTKAMSALCWDIHSARVNTWGDRAIDAFYVTDESGAKLGDDAADLLRDAIIASMAG